MKFLHVTFHSGECSVADSLFERNVAAVAGGAMSVVESLALVSNLTAIQSAPGGG